MKATHEVIQPNLPDDKSRIPLEEIRNRIVKAATKAQDENIEKLFRRNNLFDDNLNAIQNIVKLQNDGYYIDRKKDYGDIMVQGSTTFTLYLMKTIKDEKSKQIDKIRFKVKVDWS